LFPREIKQFSRLSRSIFLTAVRSSLNFCAK
jgi:hypothetical protein